jgi:ABC-2 type transport system permease protein
MMRRLKALIVKEGYQIIRDPSSILIAGFLPLLLLFVYGSGVSLDANTINLGIVIEDSAPDVVSFVKALTDSPYFNTMIARDRRELVHHLMSGHLRGIVIIPSYFSAFRQKPDQPAPILVIADGSEPNTAKFVTNYVQGAWALWLQQEHVSSDLRGLPLIRVQPRFWYNEELESRNFLIPGSLAIIMTLIGTLLTAMVVAREWERGTMEAMLSTPVTIFELLFGKLIPYYFLAIGTLVMVVSLAEIFYDIPFRGSWFALLVNSGTFLFPALGLGLLISTVAKTQMVAAQMSLVSAFLPAFILSGFIFEISSMPIIIQAMTYVIPARYFVSSLQTLFLVGDDWKLFAWNLIPMILVGLLFFAITVRKTKKRLD